MGPMVGRPPTGNATDKNRVLTPKNIKEVEKFGKQAKEQSIENSINLYEL